MDKEKLAIDLIQGKNKLNYEKYKKIAWLFFIDNRNTVDVFKELYPKEYLKNKNLYNKKDSTKRPITNVISECFNAWKNTDNFFNLSYSSSIEDSKYTPYIKRYIFTLVPFYEYAKAKNINFTSQEKNIIMFLFEPEPIKRKLYSLYKNIDFLTAIPKFYLKYLYTPFLEGESGIKPFNKVGKKFEFNKDYLYNMINPKQRKSRKSKINYEPENKSFKLADIHVVNRKLTKAEINREEHNFQENVFLGSYTCFKKINGEWYLVEFDKDIYLSFMSTLYRYFPDIFNSLNEKMKKLEGL